MQFNPYKAQPAAGEDHRWRRMEIKPSAHLDVAVSDHWMVVNRGHLGAEVEGQLQQDGD